MRRNLRSVFTRGEGEIVRWRWVDDCISLRPARTRPVRAIQIIEQEIKSDPIQELRKETRESQNHKKTGATAHIRGKHAAAPRSWRLGERPTVRRKEDVIAKARKEDVIAKALTGRGCLHCAGEDNDAAEERAPPAEGRASPAEGGRRRRARVLLAAVGCG
uniref:Uncharacterized protein n=1 Tax=Oryza nivara TaxID=4536 RepID=A0A0E0J9D6_ORYNI